MHAHGKPSADEREIARLTADIEKWEQALRQRLWLKHGQLRDHLLYGDDGCRDCNVCRCDYNTASFDELLAWEVQDAGFYLTENQRLTAELERAQAREARVRTALEGLVGCPDLLAIQDWALRTGKRSVTLRMPIAGLQQGLQALTETQEGG